MHANIDTQTNMMIINANISIALVNSVQKANACKQTTKQINKPLQRALTFFFLDGIFSALFCLSQLFRRFLCMVFFFVSGSTFRVNVSNCNIISLNYIFRVINSMLHAVALYVCIDASVCVCLCKLALENETRKNLRPGLFDFLFRLYFALIFCLTEFSSCFYRNGKLSPPLNDYLLEKWFHTISGTFVEKEMF